MPRGSGCCANREAHPPVPEGVQASAPCAPHPQRTPVRAQVEGAWHSWVCLQGQSSHQNVPPSLCALSSPSGVTFHEQRTGTCWQEGDKKQPFMEAVKM